MGAEKCRRGPTLTQWRKCRVPGSGHSAGLDEEGDRGQREPGEVGSRWDKAKRLKAA